MWESILIFFGSIVFLYSMLLMASYVMLLIFSYQYSSRYKQWSADYIRHMMQSSPYVPGISIVAPAYNEERTIIDNVQSLLRMDYPNFEVCIVNDGSKDRTLELLINTFDLVEVPFEYVEKVHCAPFRRLFRSANNKYARLVVVDKVNGGTKADAVNAGLNVITNPYFINTDVDCILSRDALYHCVFPVVSDGTIIAVSGTMSMSNGSTIKDGELVKVRPSSRPLPLFQDLEYKRSFLVGKMGWSKINAMNNVSGGYGLFSTEVVINAGGYSSTSFAEDMDMITRMVAYCCDFHRPYRVRFPTTAVGLRVRPRCACSSDSASAGAVDSSSSCGSTAGSSLTGNTSGSASSPCPTPSPSSSSPRSSRRAVSCSWSTSPSPAASTGTRSSLRSSPSIPSASCSPRSSCSTTSSSASPTPAP